MPVRLSILFETLRSRLWLIPALFTAGAILVAVIALSVDRELGPEAEGPFIFGGGPESARAILSTIAAAMLTFTGLVFSVTMLVLQLASSQLSPRVTRTFLRDRKNQVVLGIFVATFVYALLILREIRSVTDPGFVPSVAVWLAFALLLASVVAFIYYIDHMAHSMRASTVIASVAAETRAAIERCYPARSTERSPEHPSLPPVHAIVSGPDDPGVLQGIDVERLVGLARQADVIIEVVPRVGDAIPGGAPIALVRGRGGIDEDDIRSSLTIGEERTMDQDPAFGLRQLVDIADRALSPGVNDPTTARHVVEQLHDLLRRIASRPLSNGRHEDDDGALRVVLRTRSWDELLALACTEIRTYASSSVQVVAALRAMLDDLATITSDKRRGSVRRQLAMLPDMPHRPDEAG